MTRKTALRLALAGPLLVLASGVGSAQERGSAMLKALAGLEPGRWQLREAEGATRSVCLPDRGALIEIEHRGMQCSRFVIEDAPRTATVHYTCPGRGHGRTTLKVTTPRSVDIETQGVADGAPFQLEYRARKVGTCDSASR